MFNLLVVRSISQDWSFFFYSYSFRAPVCVYVSVRERTSVCVYDSCSLTACLCMSIHARVLLRCAKCNLASLLPSSACVWVCVCICPMCLFPVFVKFWLAFLYILLLLLLLFFFHFLSDSTIRLWVPTNQVHGDGKAHENTVSLQLKMPSIVFFSHSLSLALSFPLCCSGDCFFFFFIWAAFLCSWVLCQQRMPSHKHFSSFLYFVQLFLFAARSIILFILWVYLCMRRPPMSATQQQIKHVEKNLYQPFGFGFLNFCLGAISFQLFHFSISRTLSPRPNEIGSHSSVCAAYCFSGFSQCVRSLYLCVR